MFVIYASIIMRGEDNIRMLHMSLLVKFKPLQVQSMFP